MSVIKNVLRVFEGVLRLYCVNIVSNYDRFVVIMLFRGIFFVNIG